MNADVSDGDLARLARGGDPVAFRLLVERHQAMVRARARQLGPDPGDVDDIVQESFLQAFLALDRLRDPDRFAGWLAGIVFNVCRSLHRRPAVTLLGEWPESLHRRRPAACLRPRTWTGPTRCARLSPVCPPGCGAVTLDYCRPASRAGR